ncbi:ATPase domain-containing protein [Palaeococcus sp. (in: euryarchaeotes)]|uniref:ATPase domain-containing protein n=1 Tax=Palaeococcus sp. (in: euryarchaeotes) TaxID=2820298 RepID=UPI000F29E9D9|nr:ATPase domain-containing protein [Palaeococcus sp. (in: euryarchaeotes)]MCD6559940.1 flagellar accessory protein FlaH [Palaeococcus sp. (in: euryarchaeotes)]RLF78142.1 MAG: flagellar accessory protein FlaH [Thermococci archaeon]
MGALLKIQIPNDELHRRLGGGIPGGSIVVIEGDRGTGKSIFSQRLLYGFLKNDYSVAYVSSQYTTPEFINQMDSLGYGIIHELIKRKLLFISLYPLMTSVSKKEKFLPRFLGEPRLWEKQVVIIDSISSIFPRELKEEELRRLTEHLKKLSSLNKVIIMTVNPNEMDEKVLSTLEEVSSILIRLQVKVFGGDLKNSATIVKYNNAMGIFQKIIPFRVEPRVGFIVEIAAVV